MSKASPTLVGGNSVRSLYRHVHLPYWMLAVSLALTLLFSYYAHRISRDRKIARFHQIVQPASAGIQRDLRSCLTLLDTVRGLALARVAMNPGQFHDYVASLDLPANYPGVQGLGVAFKVPAELKEEAVARGREQLNYPDFQIWPESSESNFFPVIFFEPKEQAGPPVIGFDLAFDPEQRAAINLAAETAKPAATGKLLLPGNTGGSNEIGFFLVGPVYRVGKAPESVEERMSTLLGCVFCPFAASSLIHSSFQSPNNTLFTCRIYAGTTPDEDRLLCATASQSPSEEHIAGFTAEFHIDVAGQPWTLVFSPTQAFWKTSGIDLTSVCLIGGSLLSLSLFGISRSQAKARTAAEAYAADLKKSEERFRELAEAMPQIVWTSHPDGSTEYVNQRWSDYTGLTAQGDRVWASDAVVHPGDLQKTVSKWKSAVRSGDPFEIECRLRRASDGEYRWHLCRAISIQGEDGQTMRWIGACSEIDEQKRVTARTHALNEELERRVQERTMQLQAANKELEAFCYSVSHDLRAPLRHIEGFAEILAQETGSTLQEQNRRYLNLISDAARKMSQLIDDLLEFSRMGRQELKRRSVDLNRLVAEAVQSLEPETRGRNIVWKIEPLPVVRGDAALLRQVFANLLSNAVKYSRVRNPAVIQIASEESASNEFVISVGDNGVGFDMNYSEKLFGVFQRLHTVDEYEGTGIGLANVQRIISRHGGKCWAESQVNVGATFRFSLPKGV